MTYKPVAHMADAASKNLFPLALTAYERYMLADESSAYPMVFYFQNRLAGVVNKDILHRALSDVVARHPLLSCKVQKSWLSVKWVPNETGPAIQWDHQQCLQDEPWKHPIDLYTGVGLRIWVEQRDDVAIVTYQFHHACCDGIGAGQFLEDIAISYARHFAIANGESDQLPELRQLNPNLLKTRGLPSKRITAHSFQLQMQRSWSWLVYLFAYLFKRKIPLIQRTPLNESEPQQGLALRNLKLSKAETRRLREYARQHNSSLNDVLIRDLMVTAHQWNSQSATQYKPFSGFRRGHICVLVPTSLRGPDDCELPACNVVSYLFLSQSVAAILKPKLLLEKIRDEVQLIRKYQAGWVFLQAINRVAKIPRGLDILMRQTNRMCMSTTVLTHMGNAFNTFGGRLPSRKGYTAMGDLLIEDAYGVPPIRRGTYAAFSSVLFQGRLSVSLRCCSKKFSEQDADNLLELFAKQLKRPDTPIAEVQQTETVETN